MPLTTSRRVNDLEEWEPVKIRIAGTNPTNTMFAHQDCSVTIMKQVASHVRQLPEYLSRYIRMACRRDQQT